MHSSSASQIKVSQELLPIRVYFPEKRGFDYQACKTFERRAIAELKVVEEEDLIMCLTDSQVNVHSVDESFTTVHSLNRYKPVTAFAFYYDKREAAKPTLLPNQGSEVITLRCQ